MKEDNNHNFKNYSIFLFWMPIILVSISILSSSYSFYQIRNARFKTYKVEADHIYKVINDSFDHVYSVLKNYAQEIEKYPNIEPNKISKILNSNTNELLKDDIFAWTMFDFVDSYGNLVLNSTKGTLDYPLKLDTNKRPAFKNASRTYNKLLINPPDQGLSSKTRIIPLGLSVFNSKHEYMGFIGSGISTRKLNLLIKNNLDKAIEYLIIDDENNVISSSEYIDYLKVKSFFNNYKNPIESGSFIPTKITLKNVEYRYYLKLKDYPYKILIGENKIVLDKEFNELFIPQLIRTLAVGIFLLIAIYIFYLKILKPIMRLVNVAEKISSGNLEVVVPSSNIREIDILSVQISKFIDYAKTINNQKLMLEELVKERTSKLEQALKANNEFLNNISHEVRTPLHGILGISSELVRNWEVFNEQERFKYSKMVADSGDRLLSLMHNILDLSKYNGGKMIFNFQSGDIKSLILKTIEGYNSVCLNKGIQIKLIQKKEIKNPIVFDEDRIMQVVSNLISNAIKFSPKNSTINVVLESDTNEVKISVVDQGIGIPAQELENIFLPFIQSTRSKTGAGGSGLGLSIAEEIISKHKGKIWAENNKKSGSRFSFTIPYQMSNSSVKFLDHKTLNKNDHLRILMVDDEELCLSTATMILKSEGHKVIGYKSAKQALSFLKKNSNNIDLILVDLMMPDMYGLTFIRKIKNDDNLKHLNIILQTGSSDTNEIEKALSMGINGYINKPYNKDNMIEVIKQVF